MREEWRGKDTPGFRGLLLTRSREDLHEVIAGNVRAMFDRGVIEEVRACTDAGPTAAMAIGYRDIQAHLRGALSHQECLDAVLLATRRYAKRQLTWFRNQFSFSAIDLTALRTRDELRQTLPNTLALLGTA
jgi:tRNA dimethylallyltransferase